MIKLGTNNIGKIHLGSNSIGKAYLGGNLVYQKGGSPAPVNMIPYIRGGADGSYIDTGITADNNTRVIVWARNIIPDQGYLFGSRVDYSNSAFGFLPLGSASAGRFRLDYNNSITSSGDAFVYLGGYHKYEINGSELIIDDTTVSSLTASTFSNNLNIHIFGTNTNGEHGNMSYPADICACKIYKSGTLVRDFVATNSPSAGLYDSVSETLFTNAGSGSFTYGTFNPNAYTPLEYIEGNGDSYFDSGVTAGYATQIISKFRFTTNTSNVTLLGYRGSNDWCEFDINYGNTVKMYYRLASTATWSALYNATSSNFVDQDIVLVKGKTNSASLYKNEAQIGTTVSPSSSSSYVSSGNLCVAALNLGSSYAQPFTGRIYYVGIGSSRSFVPAKKNGVAGMYDTYNDVFYPSMTETPFVSGPTY